MKSPLIPHVTEKSYALAGAETDSMRAYTFMLNTPLRKEEISKWVAKTYSVTVIDVRTVILPRKYKVVRGIKGQTAVRRKAVVRLAKGQTIEGFIQDSPQDTKE